MPFRKIMSLCGREELDEIYRWLRSDLNQYDEIPVDLKFRTVVLLKEFDERLIKLEKNHAN